jgi:hypothetical protein
MLIRLARFRFGPADGQTIKLTTTAKTVLVPDTRFPGWTCAQYTSTGKIVNGREMLVYCGHSDGSWHEHLRGKVPL